MKNLLFVFLLIFVNRFAVAIENIKPENNENNEMLIEISTVIDDKESVQELGIEDPTAKKSEKETLSTIEVTNDDRNLVIRNLQTKKLSKISEKEIKNSSVNKAGFE